MESSGADLTAASDLSPGRSTAPSRWPLRTAVSGILLGAFVFILVIGRKLWFIGDEWAFVLSRPEAWGRWTVDGLLQPHNEHWTTIPVLVFNLLFQLSGVRTYLPYLAIATLVHLAACLVMLSVLRQLQVAMWVAVSGMMVMIFLGSGAENLTWAFQLGFMASLLFGLAHLRLTMHDGPIDRRDAVGVAIGTLGLMTSGIAVTMVATVVMAQLGRRRWTAALLHGGIPAVVFALWFGAFGRNASAQAGFSPAGLPTYVWNGITTAADGLTQLRGAGPVLVPALAAGFALGILRTKRPDPTAMAMASGAVVLYVITGLGRADLGAEQAGSSRYVYVAAALLLPSFCIALDRLSRRGDAPTAALVAAGFLLWALAGNLASLKDFADARAALTDQSRLRILAAAQIADDDGADPRYRPEPIYSPDVEIAGLRRLLADGDLERPTAVAPQALLDVSAEALVSVRESTGGPDGPPLEVASADIALGDIDDGCVRTPPRGANVVFSPSPGQVQVALPQGGSFRIGVTDGVLTSEPTEQFVERGEAALVEIRSANVALTLGLEGESELCGVSG